MKVIEAAVEIVEVNVLGVLSWHARCVECEWTSRPFRTEASAVKVARNHLETGHSKVEE